MPFRREALSRVGISLAWLAVGGPMWTELLKAVGAFLSFIFFPFVVIAAVASLLMLMDRLTHPNNHHHHHPAH